MKNKQRRSNLGINARSELRNNKPSRLRDNDRHRTDTRNNRGINGINNVRDGLEVGTSAHQIHETSGYDKHRVRNGSIDPYGRHGLITDLDGMLTASSAMSLFMEDMETEEIEYDAVEDNIIFSAQSKGGEILIPALVTTPENCTLDIKDEEEQDINEEYQLTLDGVIEIVMITDDDHDKNERTKRRREWNMMNRKMNMIRRYLKREDTSEEGGENVVGSDSPGVISYSITVAMTNEDSIDPQKELSIQIEPDLMISPDVNRTTALQTIAQGNSLRDNFLTEVYHEETVLSRWTTKVPHLENILRQVFNRVEDLEEREEEEDEEKRGERGGGGRRRRRRR
uniref:Uncharacterized protein n=1 Tax=Cacopsylla melanoneura TaxID=428564 RepID=A0A8D8ZC82_9HEMI